MSHMATIWMTDDPCPACGTALTLTKDRPDSIRQDCPACGWSVIWAPVSAGGGADG